VVPVLEKRGLIGYLLLLFAFYYLVILLVCFGVRLPYPYELEWMEGGSLDHCLRAIESKPLYLEPNREFVPFIYPPFYYFAGALLMKLFGVSLVVLRGISVVSLLGASVILFFILLRETEDRFVSCLSVGLFWASYEITGYWFDLARVDSLFIFQALLGCYLLLYCRGSWTSLLAGLIFFTALLTKQATLMFYPFLLYGASKKGKGHFYAFLVSTLLLCTTFTFLYNRHTDGWFWFYTFKLPFQHHIVGRVFVRYLTKDLLGNFPYILSVVALGIFVGVHSKGREYLRTILRSRWFLIFLGGFLTSYLGRLKSGGWDNNLIYVSATVPLFFGVVLRELISDKTSALPLGKLALILTLCQFVSLTYNPQYTLPTSRDYRGGQILIERIREIPGEVYIPFHTYYAWVAKGSMQVHAGALKDLAGVYSGGWQVDRLPPDLVEAIREKRYSAIFLDEEVESGDADSFVRFIGKYYYRDRPVFRSGEPTLRFFTGGKGSPKFVYLPKGEY
jgi:hypothetical protein